MNFADYFQREPGICGGETVLRGTRVTVRTVLASLAEGSSFQEILQDYPSLSVSLRSMSARSLLLPLLPRKRIYQSRARPLLSESKTGRVHAGALGRSNPVVD